MVRVESGSVGCGDRKIVANVFDYTPARDHECSNLYRCLGLSLGLGLNLGLGGSLCRFGSVSG